MAIQFKTLGNTGLLVSNLCLGTMTFGDGSGIYESIGAVDQAGADALVKKALASGINFFDTADVYSFGQSEIALGQAFKNVGIARKDVVIATKVFMRVGSGPNDIGASRGHIMDGVEASLRRLQTDHIDLYQVHASDAVTPMEETLSALDMLVQQGKVRYIGCSNWPAWKIGRSLGVSERKKPGSLRYGAGVLLAGGARFGARNCSVAGGGEVGTVGVEPPRRRAALWQVHAVKPEAYRLTSEWL